MCGARRAGGEAERVRVADAARDLQAPPGELGGARGALRAGGGGVRDLEREGARDAVRLAGVEGEEEVAALEVGAPDVVDEREADGDGPARVDADELVGGEILGGALGVFQAAELQAGAARHERDHGGLAAPRDLHAEGRHHEAHDREAALHVAADEELLGGAAAELQVARREAPRAAAR